jgi:hypothetical protein
MWMIRSTAGVCLVGALTILGISGCGGGDNATIGGSLSGLSSGLSVTLQNNSEDSLTLTNNGSFSFATTIVGDGVYDVTVLTQPVGEACLVVNGSGSVDSAADSISSVTVTCQVTSSIEGTVSGLVPGAAVTLSDGQVLLPVATNGPFAFPGAVPPGSPYNVSVVTQPVGETCTVSNGSGTTTATGGTSVVVTCS